MDLPPPLLTVPQTHPTGKSSRWKPQLLGSNAPVTPERNANYGLLVKADASYQVGQDTIMRNSSTRPGERTPVSNAGGALLSIECFICSAAIQYDHTRVGLRRRVTQLFLSSLGSVRCARGRFALGAQAPAYVGTIRNTLACCKACGLT